jgi:hypothetical protein
MGEHGFDLRPIIGKLVQCSFTRLVQKFLPILESLAHRLGGID